jgi:ribosomal 30S subunit maturation factor RimM
VLHALQAVQPVLEMRRQRAHLADHVLALEHVQRRDAAAQATGCAE